MRYQDINPALFVSNRNQLAKALKPASLALFNSNDSMPTNADGHLPFRQNNDLFYLTGVDQENSILVICPDFPDKKYREVLF
ncbi:MAG: aminopeptidase P N-terminal domain-containing protein, partial [Cyclobacteriaceae bacterium]